MGISIKTHKLLWGRSGNKCAFEDCRHDLIADETETDDEAIIGDEAHIVAKKNNGSRGVSPLSDEDRDKYENLILLCRTHHKIIDDQFNFYTVKKLVDLKKKHESWVKGSLEFDTERNKEELTYASNIDEIVNKLDFQNWNVWTSMIFGGTHSISYIRYEQLGELCSFIVTRFWSQRYPELENAIFNLKLILRDFLNVFIYHAEHGSLTIKQDEELESKFLHTEKFYRLIWHENRNDYIELIKDYEFHVALVCDLGLELTRAGNLVIEKIRQYIYPMYREKEGKLLIKEEIDSDSFNNYTVEYTSEEKMQKFPYFGLEAFMLDRMKQDVSFGTGVSKKYL